MSSIPSPPPLPPLETRIDNLFPTNINSNEDENDNNILFYDINIFLKKTITKIKAVAQTGPNCGLAALAMVSSLTPNSLTVHDIFMKAKLKRFTTNGEMFSVKDMSILAEGLLLPWFRVDMFSDGLAVNKEHVIDMLYNENLMLIPYDADKDHSPCCKKGHKAHWALVCGVMTSDIGEVYVAARHGKSSHLAIWSLDSLQQSNDNLVELDPSRAASDKEYLVPSGGVKEGLASKFILLTKMDS